jgi:hypothetical protein
MLLELVRDTNMFNSPCKSTQYGLKNQKSRRENIKSRREKTKSRRDYLFSRRDFNIRSWKKDVF